MASRDDDDRDERHPPRRRDRDEDDDDRPPRRRDDDEDDRGSRGRRRERDDYDDEDDRPRRRRRRESDDPRATPASGDGVVGNEFGLALGITGIVCGASALTFSFIPCFGMWALWPGIIAAVISLIGFIVSTKMRAVPIAGLVVSLMAVGFALVQKARVDEVEKAADQLKKDFDKKTDEFLREMERLEKERLDREKNKPGN